MFSFLKSQFGNTYPVSSDLFKDRVIEGADVYEQLAPVNKLTGLRENPLRLLETLANSPEKSRALQFVLQELPVIASKEGISNDDMLEFMEREFCTGTPAENELWCERLEALSDGIFNALGVSKSDVKPDSTISFDKGDAPVATE